MHLGKVIKSHAERIRELNIKTLSKILVGDKFRISANGRLFRVPSNTQPH